MKTLITRNNEPAAIQEIDFDRRLIIGFVGKKVHTWRIEDGSNVDALGKGYNPALDIGSLRKFLDEL